MIAALRAEFRKLLTVRSTYLLAGFALLILFIFAFYVDGWRTQTNVPLFDGKLAQGVINAVMAVSLFATIAGVLLVTHEYRYNTINYALTLQNRRWRVLAAKVIATSAFVVVFTLVFAVLSPLLSWLGATLHGINLGPQTFDVWDLLWRSVFYGWAYSMIGLGLAFLIRHQVGVLGVLLFGPGIVEGLAGLILKENAKYLPFSSLGNVLGQTSLETAPSHAASAGVVMIYVVVLWIAAVVLFQRRDAN